MKNIQQNEKKRNYNWYFSFAEREIIEKMKKQHVSNRKIWKILWRWKSSISDEINRYKTRASWYEACLAQKQFERNQKNKWNKKKIDNNEKTKKYILEKLDEDRSPEEISWRIKLFHNDPYCSYQKGAIENLNMFIRQYLPRNTNVSKLTPHDIYIIQEKLNNRPRKCLWYLSPNEFFYKKTWVKPN